MRNRNVNSIPCLSKSDLWENSGRANILYLFVKCKNVNVVLNVGIREYFPDILRKYLRRFLHKRIKKM